MENVATPVAQAPLFLMVVILLSLIVFAYTLITAKERAYKLGPILGRTGAMIATWIPVLFALCGAMYFGSKLLLG